MMLKKPCALMMMTLLVIITLLSCSSFFASAQATNATNTTTILATTSLPTTTTTTTEAPAGPAPEPPAVYNLFNEDRETYSNAIAMAIAAGVVSAFSGNPISVMYTLRTNMVLSLCFEPVEERVAVMQFPFLQKFGNEADLSRYVGAALYNVGAMILGFIFFILMAFAMKSAKEYSLERAFHKLRFPGILYSVVVLLGGPSLYCAAGVLTKSSDAANIVIAIVALVFWAVVVILLPIVVGKVFDAEYIITQNVESQEQEKMLALTGLKDEATNSSRDSGSEKSSVSEIEENDGVKEPDAYANEGAFAGIFSQLRTGIEGMRDNTVGAARNVGELQDKNKLALSNKNGAADDMEDLEEKDQQEEDMKQLAASTVDVLRQMFHHVKRTGGDEEKLLAAVHGTGEWRDKKKSEDFLIDEEEDDEEPLSFMRRYGIFFDQYNKRNRFHGFLELFASFAACACANFWFFEDYRPNCMLQSFSYLGISLAMFFLLFRRRPFIAKINHGYTMCLIVLHVLAGLCFSLGVIFEVRGVVLTGYILGICAIYLNAFRALLDLYLVIVTKISGNRDTWPAIQQLTDLFLAAKDRRDKGQMMTGPEMTNDRASARSGKSAKSAASRRSARYTQQYGKNGIQLFFKMSTDGDRYSGSRAIPEEYHPFIMKPLPEAVVLLTEERRQALREKVEKAAAKAKWEAALNQLSAETGMNVVEQAQISAAEQFKEEEFDEDAAEREERKRQEEKKRQDEKKVPRLVRELFQMGLKTKFDEADQVELQEKKVDDLLFPTESKRADKYSSAQRAAMEQRELIMASALRNKKKESADDEKKKSSSKTTAADDAADEAFSSWINQDSAAVAELALREQKEQEMIKERTAAALAAQNAEADAAPRRVSATERRQTFIKGAKEAKKKEQEEQEKQQQQEELENGTNNHNGSRRKSSTSKPSSSLTEHPISNNKDSSANNNKQKPKDTAVFNDDDELL